MLNIHKYKNDPGAIPFPLGEETQQYNQFPFFGLQKNSIPITPPHMLVKAAVNAQPVYMVW